jgi:hypothetical protein
MQQPRTAFSLYLQIFVKTAIPFGLAMAFLYALHGVVTGRGVESVLVRVATGLAGGALFGLAMSAIMGTLTVWSTRGSGHEALAVVQERVVEVRGELRDVVERVRAAVADLPGAQEPFIDAHGRRVESRIGWSWKSWGEIVIAKVESAPGGGHAVRVTSRPVWGLTVVDYGKGYANVEAVERALMSHALAPS